MRLRKHRKPRPNNMARASPRPPRQSFLEGPSTVFWVAVVACTVVIRPSLMPAGHRKEAEDSSEEGGQMACNAARQRSVQSVSLRRAAGARDRPAGAACGGAQQQIRLASCRREPTGGPIQPFNSFLPAPDCLEAPRTHQSCRQPPWPGAPGSWSAGRGRAAGWAAFSSARRRLLQPSHKADRRLLGVMTTVPRHVCAPAWNHSRAAQKLRKGETQEHKHGDK